MREPTHADTLHDLGYPAADGFSRTRFETFSPLCVYWKVDARSKEGAALHSDEDIVRLCRQGRQEGFSLLLRTYQGRVYRRAYSFLRHHEDALDATQDVFLRTVNAIGHFRPGNPLWPWLRKITTTTCLNRIRAKASRPETLSWDPEAHALASVDSGTSPEHAAELAWDREALHRALSELPAVHRMVVVLRHEEDLTYEQIADVTNLPLGTVKTYLFRARRALRESLRDEVVS